MKLLIYYMIKHQDTSSDQQAKFHRCPLCKRSFSNRSNLLYHQRSKHQQFKQHSTRNTKGRPIKQDARELVDRQPYYNVHLVQLIKYSLLLAKITQDSDCGFFKNNVQRKYEYINQNSIFVDLPPNHVRKSGLFKHILKSLNNVFNKETFEQLTPLIGQIFLSYLNNLRLNAQELFGKMKELKCFERNGYAGSDYERGLGGLTVELAQYIKTEILKWVKLDKNFLQLQMSKFSSL